MKGETQILAAKLLAQILSGEENQSQAAKDESLSQVLARLDEMNSRLVQIENKIATESTSVTNSSNSLNPVFPILLHSSQERFSLEDAVDPNTNEKACHFEPGGKPCDYCAMCSSRGF
jgi:hypothetical protein